jgi:hypothetical protein
MNQLLAKWLKPRERANPDPSPPPSNASLPVPPGFFDETPFGGNARNNERYRRIIEPNLEHIRGRRVLDLGSHFGAWSWAALSNGASYVLGIEGRADTLERGRKHFTAFDRTRYDFICADVFAGLRRSRATPFDTIFCLGLFYHVMDHDRLLRLMAQYRPSAIIIDTGVIISENPCIQLQFEDTSSIANALPDDIASGQRLVGMPSIGAMRLLAKNHGFDARMVPWVPGEVFAPEQVQDYLRTEPDKRGRATFVLTPTTAIR